MFGFFFKLILLLFLATGSYLAYLSTNQIEIETSLESSERIYSLKNAEFFGSDTQGELTYKIFSKKAKTESGDDQIILEHVNLEYYSDELNDWKISSEKGAMYDDANLLVLTGNVLIENHSTIRPSLIETEYIEINPSKMTIATNKKVKITLNNNTIEAIGFNAMLEENQIKFRTNNALNSKELCIMSILIAESLEKKYRSRKVVNNLSFNIKSGEIIGLLGPNGAGKTTAFYMTVGLVSCSNGKITLDDLDITHYPIHKRAKIGIGYLPQEASVFRKLTVQENILAVLEMRKGLSLIKRMEILEKLLDQLNLNEIRNTIGMSLSGGERRRVEIARTLSIEPKFILLDEPFAGVDPISVLDIQGIIKSLASEGIGILITDHNVRETLGICDRGYIVNEGTSIAYGTPDQILENKQVKKVYLGESFRM